MSKARRDRRLPVLLPLTTAAAATGLKYDTLSKAVASGELQVSAAERKPGGGLQPLVSVRDVIRYRKLVIRRYQDSGSSHRREIASRVEAAEIPEPFVMSSELVGAASGVE